MKVAFHFNADYEKFKGFYGWPIEKAFFRKLLALRSLSISTKIFAGDLMLHHYACKTVKVTDSQTVKRFDKRKFFKLFEAWIRPSNPLWVTISQENLQKYLNSNIFVLCFESMDFRLAEQLDNALKKLPYYLGAMEVDDSSAVHWAVYSNSLVPTYRLINKDINIFWDEMDGGEKDERTSNELKKIGFINVNFENLKGKFSIFDKYHDFEHAKRIAEWKKQFGSTLAFIADDIVSRLSDIAPEVGNKLWAVLNTYETAETTEQYAQASTSCRRVLEYVINCIFPPTNEKHNDHKLGESDFKNRLLAFADREHKSRTNIDLICVSTQSLDEQLEKLLALQNKGVHSEIMKSEVRRCLIRTVLLLDDIIRLKKGHFKIESEKHIDSQMLIDMIKGKEE